MSLYVSLWSFLLVKAMSICCIILFFYSCAISKRSIFIVEVAKFGMLAGCRVPNAFSSRSGSLSDLKRHVRYPVLFVIKQAINVKASGNFSLQRKWHLAAQYGTQPIIVLNKSHGAFKVDLTKLMKSNACEVTEPQVVPLLCLDVWYELWSTLH